MARALSFLIRYFSNYYTLHHSDLAARAAPLDPRLRLLQNALKINIHVFKVIYPPVPTALNFKIQDFRGGH